MFMATHLVGFGAAGGDPLRTLTTVTVSIGITGGGAGPDTFKARLYTNSGSSPGTQIGSDSDTVDLHSTGTKTFTFASPPEFPAAGTYWVVIVPVSTTGDIFPDTVANSGSHACGTHATITSIAATGQVPASVGEEWRIGINVTLPVADVGLGSSPVANQRTMPNGNSFGMQFSI